jgi:hypothetical protein
MSSRIDPSVNIAHGKSKKTIGQIVKEKRENAGFDKSGRTRNREEFASTARVCMSSVRNLEMLKSPFGKAGDLLWVRETFALSGYERYEYRAFPADGKDFRSVSRWKPSIHMPRKASRITLRVKRVWVERVQDISEADAMAEGVEKQCGICGTANTCSSEDYSQGFFNTWESIYGNWAADPWVWCCEFERVEQ